MNGAVRLAGTLGVLAIVLLTGRAQADEPPRRLRVLDAAGRPLAGAQLVGGTGRHGTRRIFDRRARVLASTDGRGMLALPAGAPPVGGWIAWAPEHAPVLVTPAAGTSTVRLLRAAASGGTILRSRRRPAAARDVLAVPAAPHAELVHLVRTDEQGAYRFTHLHAGDWTILLREGTRRVRPIGSVRAGGSLGAVRLTSATSLKGRILDADGTRRDSIGAVALRLVPLSGGGADEPVDFRTEADGTFLVGGMREGLYRVELRDPTWVFEPEPPRVQVERGRARDLSAWFALRRQRVVGTVRTEEGAPLPRAGIRLVPEPGRPLPAGASPEGTPTVFSDGKGRFAVRGVAPGEGYRLIATAEGHSPFVSSTFRVDRAETTELKPFRMRRGWRIELRVRDLDGAPVAKAAVVAASARRPSSLGDPLWGDTIRRGATDAAGRLTLPDLPEDDVLVQVTAPGFEGGDLVVSYPRVSNARRADVTLTKAVHLAGQLSVPEGGPAGPFAVRATRRDGGGSATARAAADGRFRLEGLAATAYDVTVEQVVDDTQRRHLVTLEGVIPGIEDVVEIALPRLFAIAGAVETLHLDGPVPRLVVETRAFDAATGRYAWRIAAEAPLQPEHTRAVFRLPGLSPGAYTVRVVQGALDTGTIQLVLDEADVEGLTLRMPSGARIAGAVRDEIGRALLGARVVVTRMHGAEPTDLQAGRPLEDRADERGDFMFEGLAPGLWRVEASDAERAADVRVVRVRDGEVLVIDDLVLGAGAQLEGLVEDADGRPLDGVHVLARRYDGDGASLTLRTDADGRFRARHVRPGAWLVTVDAATVAGGPWIESLVEAVAGETVQVRFTASEDGAIGGTVRRRGAVVAGAVLDLVHEPEGEGGGPMRRYRASTGADGRFRFDGLEAGRYMLQVQSGAWRGTRSLRLEPSDELEIDVEAFEARLRGRIVTRDGRAVGGAHVRATPLDEEGRVLADAPFVGEGRSDPRGAFVLRGLPPGPYLVTASAPGLPPGRFDGAEADLPGADFAIEVVLGRGGDVALRVIDENDRGITGARVWLEDERGVALNDQPYVTGAAGRLTIEGVQAGAVRVRVQARGLGTPALRGLVVEEGGLHPLTLRLLPAGAVRLTVTGEGSDPLFRSRIDILRAGSREVMARRRPLSPIRLGDPWGWVPRTGVVTIGDLEAGRYIARIDAGRSYEIAEVPIEVKTGLVAELRVTLAPR